MLFTCKNFVFRFYVENIFLLYEMVGSGGGGGGWLTPPCPSPFSLALYYEHIMNKFQL